jgi:replicative DNA helicase
MSSNIEMALLTRVVDDKDFQALEKAQINDTFFLTPEAQEVYRFLRDTYHDPSTAGMVPSREMVQYRFPGIYFFPSTDPAPVLAAQLKREKLRLGLLTLAQNIQLLAERDPMAAVAEIQGEVANFRSITESSTDLSLASAYQLLLQNYETTQASGGLLGIPYPWDVLNDDTQGMQPGQLIVLYGRPGSMKSWLAIYIGIRAYMRARRRVLFYTREMSQVLVAQRAAAAIAEVDYKAFKSGKLQPDIKEYVFGLLRDLVNDEKSTGTAGQRQPYFIILHDKGGGGVSWLQAKIKEMDPDLVVVDGMYLMKDDRGGVRNADWKSIAHISQDLKLTAANANIPIVTVTQGSRKTDDKGNSDLGELAYSDAIGQDADAVFRVSKKDKIDEAGVKRTELFLTSPKIREGRFDGIVLHGEPATNFDFIRGIVNTDNDPDDYNPGGSGSSGGSGNSSGSPSRGPSFKRRAASFMDPRIPLPRR